MGNSNTSSRDGQNRGSSKFRGKPSIAIKTCTWTRDSHGLFDYESKTLTKKNLKTSNPGRILRHGNEIRLSKENDKTVIKEEKELLRVMIRDGEVYVDNCRENKESLNQRDQNLENTDEDLWLVVKSMKTSANSRGYQLTEGDLIKLGRVKFRVREFRGGVAKPNKAVGQTKIEDDNDNVSIVESEKKDSATHKGSMSSVSAQTCRICLSESADAGDPFFSPCNCTGTMKYIHVKCLQRWLKSKLHTKTSANSNSVYWKTLECELCKTPFPTFFVVEEKRYDIVEFDRPDCPYIILDILSKDKGITRGIHVIKMENKTNIRLGRAHDSDIRITDISVSRCHAFIKLEKGHFYLDDNNSKFGTLIHLKKAFNVPMDLTDVSLQVGRTVVALTVKKGRRFLPACFGGPSNKNNVSRSEQDSESEVEEEESEGENEEDQEQEQEQEQEQDQDQEANSPANRSNNEQSVRNQRQTSLNNNNSPISIRAANQIQGEEPEEGSEQESRQEEEEEQNIQDLELPVADAQDDNESDRSANNGNNDVNVQISDQNDHQLQVQNVAGSVTLNHNNQPVSAIEDGPVD